MGSRVQRIPELFWKYERVVLSTGIHEPVILTIDNCLWTLNEMLLSSPVLMQAYSNTVDDSEIINVPFPFQETDTSDENTFVHHLAIQELRKKLNLDAVCGYIVLLKLPKPEEKNSRKLWEEFLTGTEKEESEERSVKSPEPEIEEDDESEDVQSLNRYGSPTFGHSNLSSNISKDPRKIPFTRFKLNKGESLEDFVLMDCVFGIPLFSEQLNEEICRRIQEKGLLASEHFPDVKFAVQNIVELITDFVKNHRSPGYKCPFQTDINMIPYPTDIVVFDSEKKIKIQHNLF
uniref:FAM91 C-terminal domain-containing protein n=1 Tax=Acrobeloides nanus TaxID=290746 RepID=A0A914EIF2_9BILA